jgi:hypothetical protein
MESCLKMVLKLVVLLFAVMGSLLLGGAQGTEISKDGQRVCEEILPCYRPTPCCKPPSGKATQP